MPSTCGFTDCIWRYKGRKSGETILLTGQWREAGHSYHRFTEGGQAEWDRLLIQARPLVEIEEEEGEEEENEKEEPAAKKAKKKGKGRDKKATKKTTTSTTVPSAIDHTWGGCTICKSNRRWGSSFVRLFSPTKERVLQCGHRFHTKCLAGWEKGSMIVCPNCREESPLASR